jgi:predicted phage tail protein
VALSEHAEALLPQMEEALYAEDPRFASRIEKTKSRGVGRGRVVIGVVAAVAGLALVVVSAMSSLIWLGAIGFAIMVAGIVYAITPSKTKLAVVDSDGTAKPRVGRSGASSPKAGSSKQGTFMERMEERWEKRRRDQW